MNIRVNRADLERELGLARRLSDRKTTIPVYDYALLEPDAERLSITATDGESGFVTGCPVTVEQAGRVLVPVRTLHEIAKAATAEEIRLVQDGARVRVMVGSFRSTLQTLPVDDFPVLSSAPPADTALPTVVLRAAIAKVRFVTEVGPSSPMAPHMRGALLDVTADTMRLVGTDGRRLALVEAPYAGEPMRAIISRRTLDDLAALLAESEEPQVLCALDGSRLFFTVGRRLLISSVLDATYPAWERVVPAANSGPAVKVDRDVWLGALRRVMLVSTEQSMRVMLAMEAGLLTISMGGVEIGDAVEPMPAELAGNAWSVGFNARYLAEFLAAADGGLVMLEQKAPMAAGAFRTADGAVKYTYCLMPMRGTE